MDKDFPVNYISAKKLMERWGIDHVTLGQLPIEAYFFDKSIPVTDDKDLDPIQEKYFSEMIDYIDGRRDEPPHQNLSDKEDGDVGSTASILKRISGRQDEKITFPTSFSPRSKEDFEKAVYYIVDIEAFERTRPEVKTENRELHCHEQQQDLYDPPDLKGSNKIDYSKKSAAELKELVKRWFENGMTRWQIAQKLYPDEIESVKKATLQKRVDRIK